MHEAQDHVFILTQADQQIKGIAFLWLAFLAAGLLRGRVGSHSSLDEFPVASFKVLRRSLGQAGLALAPRVLHLSFDFEEQRFHLFSPQLFILFKNEGQFAQNMGKTESMKTQILEVARKAIVNGCTDDQRIRSPSHR